MRRKPQDGMHRRRNIEVSVNISTPTLQRKQLCVPFRFDLGVEEILRGLHCMKPSETKQLFYMRLLSRTDNVRQAQLCNLTLHDTQC